MSVPAEGGPTSSGFMQRCCLALFAFFLSRETFFNSKINDHTLTIQHGQLRRCLYERSRIHLPVDITENRKCNRSKLTGVNEPRTIRLTAPLKIEFDLVTR